MTKFHCFYIFLALWAIFWQWVVAAAERMQGKCRLPLTGLKSESTSVKGKAVHVHNRNTHAHASCLINLNDRAAINSDYQACGGGFLFHSFKKIQITIWNRRRYAYEKWRLGSLLSIMKLFFKWCWSELKAGLIRGKHQPELCHPIILLIRLSPLFLCSLHTFLSLYHLTLLL